MAYFPRHGSSIEQQIEAIISILRTRADQKRSMWQWFKSWDLDRDGKLDNKEFADGLTHLNFVDIPPEVATGVAREFDLNGDGKVDFYDFCCKMRPTEETTAVTKANNLVPTPGQLTKVLCKLWRHVRDKNDLYRLFSKYDPENRGSVERLDFVRAMHEMRALNNFDVDQVINSGHYTTEHGLINFHTLIHDADFAGIREQAVMGGLSPRICPPNSTDSYRDLHPSRKLGGVSIEEGRRISYRNSHDNYLSRRNGSYTDRISDIFSPDPSSPQFVSASDQFRSVTHYPPAGGPLAPQNYKRAQRNEKVYKRIQGRRNEIKGVGCERQVILDDREHRRLTAKNNLRCWYEQQIAFKAREPPPGAPNYYVDS